MKVVKSHCHTVAEFSFQGSLVLCCLDGKVVGKVNQVTINCQMPRKQSGG